MNQSPTPLRSLLYVPGDREAMLAKAAGRGADALILNLEDAVAPASKTIARENVVRALNANSFGASEVIVRVNPPATETGYRDLMAIAPCRPDAILLPKVSSPEEVRFVAWTIERVQAMHSTEGPATMVMCMIESARGVVAAPAIAACHSSVIALIFGATDLSMEVGCVPTPSEGALRHAASSIVLAARAAGIAAVDTPHMKLDDPVGLAHAARQARDLGFDGKSAIHPSQIAPINAAFSPDDAQITWARQVLALMPDGEPGRLGAAVLNGQLIEAPHIVQARRILAATETSI